MDFLDGFSFGRAYIITGIAALVAALLVGLQSRRRSHAKVLNRPRGTSTLLFVGPMNSGKTSFFGRVSRTFA